MKPRHPLWCLALFLPLLVMPLTATAKPQLLDRIAAVVNNSVITEHQLTSRMTQIGQRLAQSGQPKPPQKVLREQVLDHMIMNTIQLGLAKRAGIKIDDNTLNEALANIAKEDHLTLAQFADQVRHQGKSWPAFRDRIREQLAIGKLRHSQIGRRVHVSKQEIDQFLASAQGQKLFSYDLHLQHLLVRLPPDASDKQQQTAKATVALIKKKLKQGVPFTQLVARYSDADDALKGGDWGWKSASELPTLFVQAATKLSPGDVSAPLKSGNGYHFVKLIKRRGNSGVQVVTQYKVKHILIQSDTLHTSDDAKQQAKKLRQAVLGGKSFAKLAKNNSDDPGSASKGGELGWVLPESMDPAFAKEIKSTPVGQLSPVFHTHYGWHFLKVEATRKKDVSKRYRRMQAANALHKRHFEEQLQLWLGKIRSEAYVNIRQ